MLDDALAKLGVSWEALVVSGEIAAAVATALWLLYRRSTRHEHLLLEKPAFGASPSSPSSDALLFDGEDAGASRALSPALPLMEPRACWTLRSLLRFRAAVVAFYVVVQVGDVIRSRGHCLVFYTSWNFIGQGAYFASAAVETYRLLQERAFNGSQAYASLLDDGSTSPYRRWANTGSSAASRRRRQPRGWLRADLLLDVLLATSILIAVVVWTILYPYAVKVHQRDKILNWVSYCQHGINVVLLQVEFLATHHSVSVDALPLMLLWPSIYTVFTWILHGTVARGFWPYPFLELDTPWAPVWYLGLLLAHLAAFVLVLAISRTKRPPRLPTAQELSPH